MKSLPYIAVALGAALSVSGGAYAQSFPTRPITVIVPYAAGGAIDVSTRVIGRKLSELLKQAVIVENKTGAAGTIGGVAVARAAPDGYTLLAGSPGTMTAPAAFGLKLPYDTIRDFSPVALVVTSPNIVVTSPDKPAQTMRQLLDRAASNPGKVTFASAGVGTTTHMAGEMLQSMGNIKMLHVPYKGTSIAINDVLAGHVDFMVADASALAFVKAGKLRALAVATKEPSPLIQGVPTVAASGLPGYGITNWHGWFAPAGTSQEVVGRLHAALEVALKDPEVVKQLANAGMEAVTTKQPEELLVHQKADIEQWRSIVQKAGIKFDQ